MLPRPKPDDYLVRSLASPRQHSKSPVKVVLRPSNMAESISGLITIVSGSLPLFPVSYMLNYLHNSSYVHCKNTYNGGSEADT